MPIWLRRYTFEELSQYYKEQNNDNNKQTFENKIARPDIRPDYTTKASK